MFTPQLNDEKGSETILIMDLPVELLEKIFQYLPYESIGKIRLVSKTFNDVCSSLLNSAFQRLQNLMLQRFQKIKSQMPRRESARRKHPLARESDIIETLHMRLTLLQMSFGKHIERKHCCFFAGEILDEVYRILRYVKTTPNLARAYKVTDELFDLSTMAMEYFKEHIEPTLPEITYFGTDFLEFNSFSGSGSKSCSWKMLDSPGTTSSPTSISNQGGSGDDTGEGSSSGTTLRKKLNHFRQAMKRYDKKQTNMLQDMKRCKNKLGNHERQMEELNNRLEDCNKKAEESSRKFNAVLQELNKCKTELQYWRSKSPANQLCCVCSKMLVSGEEVSATHSNSVETVALVAKELPSSTSHSETDFIPIGKPIVDINAEDTELLCGPETSSYLPSEDSGNSSPQPSCSKTVDISPPLPGLKRTWTSTEKCIEEQPQSKKHCCDKDLISQMDSVKPPLSQTTKNLIQTNST